MNKLFGFLALLLALVSVPKDSLALPNPRNVEFRMNHGDYAGPLVQPGYQAISNKVQLLKCKYDFAALGGSTATSIKLVAVDGSKCELPINSLVIGGIVDVLTQPITIGQTTASLSIGTGIETLGNLVASLGASSWSVGRVNLIPVRTAATSVKSPATVVQNPEVLITNSNLTTGKFNLFLEYLLSD